VTSNASLKPNFLIVGAAKSGTTSLYHYLKARPDVFLSSVRKEGRYFSAMADGSVYWPRYYNFDTAGSWPEYLALFDGYAGEKRIGDTSPDYLAYAHRAAPAVLNTLGAETKIIAILRNPVTRAWSHYLQNVRREAEFFSFERTLDLEASRAAANWGFQWLYRLNGQYSAQLPHYMERFDTLVLFQDDLNADAPATLARVEDFLGLEPGTAPLDAKRYNSGGIPASLLPVLEGIHDSRDAESFEALHAGIYGGNAPGGPSADGVYPPAPPSEMIYPALPEHTRQRLITLLAPSIGELETLVNRDLSHWSQP